MKNRMMTYFASMAIFLALIVLVPGPASGSSTLTITSYGANNTYSGCTTISAGTLTLNSYGANTYSGGTTISAGTLTLINGGNFSLSGGLIKVSSGSMLSGTGALRAVTMDAGSTLSVGNSPGTMTFEGAELLSVGSTNIMEIFTGGLDVLKGDGAGTLTMSGATVFDFTGNNGSTFELFQNWSPIPTVGSTFDLGASQPLNTDNAGFVTVIPEPASAMMLLFGAGVGLAVHRARRSAMRR